jgi:hypothetical protein
MSAPASFFRLFTRTPQEKLAADIPAFRAACEKERIASQRGDTKAIGRARRQKREAVHAALEGR